MAPEAEPAVSDALAHRLQALVAAFEVAPPPAARPAHHDHLTPPPPGHPDTIEDLQHQLDVLRDQLEDAFDEVERRIAVADTRAADAERRAGELAQAVELLLRAMERPPATRREESALQGALDDLRQRLASR